MTDAPEKIWVGPNTSEQWDFGDWDLTGDGIVYAEHATPYIRADLSDARVAAAYEGAAEEAKTIADQFVGYMSRIEQAIRAKTPADAQAALEARDKRVREDALREAAEKAGEAAVNVLLRHEPDASALRRQTAKQAAKTFILALISEDKTDG